MKIVTLIPMRREVAVTVRNRPTYAWRVGYLIEKPDGSIEYPPLSRSDAFKRARELGARIEIRE